MGLCAKKMSKSSSFQAQEECNDSKKIYEELNNDLLDELPTLYDKYALINNIYVQKLCENCNKTIKNVKKFNNTVKKICNKICNKIVLLQTDRRLLQYVPYAVRLHSNNVWRIIQGKNFLHFDQNSSSV